MKHSRFPRSAFSLGILSAALIVAALRSAIFALAFDHVTGYSTPRALPTLLYIALALALGGCVACAVLIATKARHGELVTADFSKRPTTVKVSSFPVAVTCAVAAVYGIYRWTQGASAMTLVYSLAALIAIPYFVPAKPIKTCAWFGFGTLVACVLSAAIEYFDPTVAMNSPIKLMQQFSALALALYFLTELYALAGKQQPLRAPLFGSIAIVLSLSNGISNVVAFALGDILSLDYLMRALVLLALGLYTAARMPSAYLIPSDQNQQTEEA